MSDILFEVLDATELSQVIRNKEVSVEHVIASSFKRLDQINPSMNALVESNRENAFKEAKRLDGLSGKSNSWLFGVPYSVKEMLAVNGFKSTIGSVFRADRVLLETASCVEKYEQAEGVMIGTTNVPEVGLWFECKNKVYGQTNNPYDVHRTCGGSSGGEAVLLATRASFLGIGSDVGGSVRLPASFCGVYGHKPSTGVIPFTGHWPLYKKGIKEAPYFPLTTIGPMALSARDLVSAFEMISEPDGFDRRVQGKFKKVSAVDWKGKKVYLLSNPEIDMASNARGYAIEAVKNIGHLFKNLGADVIEVPEDLFKKGLELWETRVGMFPAGDFQQTLKPSGEIPYLSEFLKYPFGKSDFTIPALIAGFLDKYKKIDMDKLKERILIWEKAKAEVDKLLADAILLMPGYPTVAPFHHVPVITPFDFVYTGIGNALEIPATTVPVSWEDELPVSVQILSAAGRDDLTLAAALCVETALGHFNQPKMQKKYLKI